MIYIGIDPGASGGIAAIMSVGTVLSAQRMPETEADLFAHLQDLVKHWRYETSVVDSGVCAVLERSQASPQMGRSSAFNYGRNYGALRMALTAAGISFSTVPPSAWQPAVGVPKSRSPRLGSKDKNLSKRRAQELFPALTVTHAIADALLLAEYCRRLNRGLNGKAEDPRQAEAREGSPGRDGRATSPAKGQGGEGAQAEQGSRRARAAQGADPAPAGAARSAGDGKHGRRQEARRHLPADRRPARRHQRPAPR